MDKIKKNYQKVSKLYVSKILYQFVNKELLRKTQINPKKFWVGLDRSFYSLREKK